MKKFFPAGRPALIRIRSIGTAGLILALPIALGASPGETSCPAGWVPAVTTVAGNDGLSDRQVPANVSGCLNLSVNSEVPGDTSRPFLSSDGKRVTVLQEQVRLAVETKAQAVVKAIGKAAADGAANVTNDPASAIQKCSNLDIPNVDDPSSVTPIPVPGTGGGNGSPAADRPTGSRPGESSAGNGGGGYGFGGSLPRTGTGADSGTPLSDPGNSIVSTALQTSDVAEAARGLELLNASTDARKLVNQAAQDDQRSLSEDYRRMPISEFGESLNRAYESLTQTADFLSNSPTGIDASEVTRFRNLFLNARDKAAIGIEAIQQDREDGSLGQSPFGNLAGPGGGNPLSRGRTLQEVFGGRSPSEVASTNDGLVDRIMMFNGLSPEKKAEALRKLKLAETPTLQLANGETRKITLLHNGYIFGGKGSAMDCSSFVSAILPADARKGRFTTLDFRAMWLYRRTGKLPNPPRYPGGRAEDVKKASEAFIPVNLYQGEKPAVGDLLVHRLPWETAGHVFLVKSFNPATLQVEVVEAAQSAGTVREREFALSTFPANASQRPIRPGLIGLRLKSVNNKACTYRDVKKGGGK